MASLLKIFATKLLASDIPMKHIVVAEKGKGLIVAETMDGQKEIFSAFSNTLTAEDFEHVKHYVEEIQKLCEMETQNDG